MFFLFRTNIFIVVIGLAVYLGLHFFVYYSFIRFFNIQRKAHKRLIFGLVLFLGSSFILESVLSRVLVNFAGQGLYFIFGAWMGVLLLLVPSVIVLWVLRRIHSAAKFRFSLLPAFLIIFIAPFLIIGYGAWQSFTIKINEVNISLKDLPSYWQDKTIVHIADLHLSENRGIAFTEKISAKIREISPELVVLTGDLADMGSANIRESLSPFRKISAPILFATGNHDRNYNNSENDHITLLDGNLFEKEGLQIIGLAYPGRDSLGDPAEILKNEILFDKNKPAILLFHTPTTIIADEMGDRYVSPNTDFSLVKDLGIDLQLSAHTHGGQFFPFSVLAHYIYKGYEKGLHEDGDFSLFVTTGLGTWGPPVRTFVPPEIAVIRLREKIGNRVLLGPDLGAASPENTDPAPEELIAEEMHPMAIESLRKAEYPGGDFIIDKELANGTNYRQYIASYLSEGLKIYGLLTVPLAERPKNGFPAIVFVHGYISPKQYSTTGNYPTYQARLARSGFITFKPDLRGHGNSEGEASGAHYSEKYTVDTLYAISYLKNYIDVDPDRIGYWGHSNGGEIGLRTVLVSPDIKAASFWAGVVGSYLDMLETYNSKIGFLRNASSTKLVRENGLPSQNPDFWNKLDPYFYLEEISAPIQIHHGTKDSSVPIELSRRLKEELENLNKPVEYYEYAGDNHNISNNVNTAFKRTIDFYNDNL